MSDPLVEVRETAFEGVFLFVRRDFNDDRGVFRRLYSAKEYEGLLPNDFVEDNMSISCKWALRGLHFDRRLAKFVQCLQGEIFDAMVDVRPGSATYGKWQGIRLTASGCEQLFVPPGIAQGTLAMEDGTILSYKQSDFYDPTTEGQIRWNDPEIGIDWPLGGTPIISKKDASAPFLADIRA